MLKQLSSVLSGKLLLIGGSIALTYVAITGGLIWYQHGQLTQAQQKLGEFDLALKTVNTTITTLTETAQRNQRAQAELRTQLQQVTLSNGHFQQHLKALKHDIQDVRKWAETDLPAAIGRMQQRPAITGADEYRVWMSTRYPLLPATEQPDIK